MSCIIELFYVITKWARPPPPSLPSPSSSPPRPPSSFKWYFSTGCLSWKKTVPPIRHVCSLNISRQKRGENSRVVLFWAKVLVLFRVYYMVYFKPFSTECPAKKYIQLKRFIFEKVWIKFKQNFRDCKNFLLSSFESIYWLNIFGHYLFII